mgnify:CR=1 FL=1
MQIEAMDDSNVSTHSRLKAAGSSISRFFKMSAVSTHSRLKAAGGRGRRLGVALGVSTHSRLKAAGWYNTPKTV